MFEAIPGSVIPGPSNALLERFQYFYKVNLPTDYIRFIVKHNGAVPAKGSFDCNNHSYFIERFFCMLKDDELKIHDDISWSDIGVVITEFEGHLIDDEDMIGVNLIPIALLFAGNMVCLDFRKDPNHPSVCVWDYYKSAELSPVTYKAADSFTEFLNMLY